jgi:serine/threonine protein phosphatase PrpC
VDIIEDIKTYLKNWIVDTTPAMKFRDINFDNKINMARKIIKLSYQDKITSEIYGSFSDETIVYILGLYLYSVVSYSKYNGKLNSKEIKKVRVYQFLSMVLNIDKERRESDPKILLSVLEYEPRDVIDEVIDRRDYMIEKFSSLGLVRLTNQDYLGVLELENSVTLIVADGVGGSSSGEIASKLAVDFVISSLRKELPYYLSNQEYLQDFLRDTIFNSNQEVLSYSKEHDIDMMGTTLSIALIVDKINLFVAHIGDSRIYELENSIDVRQITQDHSVREVLFRSNKITEEEKDRYKKSVLAFVLGKRNLKKENIFVQQSIIYDNSTLLLCSDGLWEKMDITKELFNSSMDDLKYDIYNTIPSDNVTFIRYFPKVSDDSSVEAIYEDYTHEDKKLVKQKPKYSTNRKLSRSQIIASKVNYIKNIVIFIAIISSITFLILRFFANDSSFVESKSNLTNKSRGE